MLKKQKINGFNDVVRETKKSNSSRIIFLGSGSSSGIPQPKCILESLGDEAQTECVSCMLAVSLPPEFSKNYRCNPSILIDFSSDECSGRRYIQVDATKNFKESVVRWYPKHGIPRLDSLLLTHDHADAIFGLDDVRGLQSSSYVGPPLPIYLSQATLNTVQTRFPYLMPKCSSEQTAPASETEEKVVRWVASLDYHVVLPFTSFFASGLKVMPLPVMHGEDYESLGFCFGEESKVVYLSDVSRIPPETLEILVSIEIEVLIIDGLKPEEKHPTHFSCAEAVDVIRHLKPKQSFLIGMCHDVEHNTVNAQLSKLQAEEGLNVELSYDGLSIDVNL